MKTLQKVQEENRKFIIMANNPSAETYKEALEMELGFGCLVKRRQTGTITNYYDINTDDRSLFDSAFEVIGKPLTLSRVLNALRNYHFSKIWYFCFDVKSCNIYGYNHKEEIIFTAYWDLTKETLEEQSEETKRKINEIYLSFFTTN